MSETPSLRRATPHNIAARKGGEPIVCLTAYTAPMAQALDDTVDLLLVGDSLGMVLYGLETTLGVTLEMMIEHTKAVMRGSRSSCVVVDMPFGSYQESPAQAFRNAGHALAETGCAAVKIEGGIEMAPTVSFLVQRGVPVLGHIGLKPQSVNTAGGYGVQGKADDEADAIIADAEAIAQAGAFAVVVENTVEPLARAITARIRIPTIGIGASPACDGQILVAEDMLGMGTGRVPRFVRSYASLNEQIVEAARAYADDVRARRFPGPEHVAGAPSLIDGSGRKAG
jgi:3-methyl-2-oxobutanoate hydroxymethyltransferase